jgi:hypothetical protein
MPVRLRAYSAVRLQPDPIITDTWHPAPRHQAEPAHLHRGRGIACLRCGCQLLLSIRQLLPSVRQLLLHLRRARLCFLDALLQRLPRLAEKDGRMIRSAAAARVLCTPCIGPQPRHWKDGCLT